MNKLKILVISGNHTIADPEKVGGRYNEEDLKAHRVMEQSFAGLPGLDCTVLADHSEFLELAREQSFDLVINFCDTGYRNRILMEPHIPSGQDASSTYCIRQGSASQMGMRGGPRYWM